MLGFLNLYTVVDFILQRDADIFNFNKFSNDQDYIKKFESVIPKFNDVETLNYLNVILDSVRQGKALQKISEIYTDEPQYFLASIRPFLNGLNIVDAGAYTGDTLRELIALGIKPNNFYAFEAESDNFQKLKAFSYDVSNINHVYFENYALWNEKTHIGMKMKNYNAKIDLESEEKNIETITLDEYFKNISVGFIKMDIEGAERYALSGGMNIILRDRPILAISIYHSLEDVVDIPNMLMSHLDNYNWFIRKHSSTYSEAVLYGIPYEKLNS